MKIFSFADSRNLKFLHDPSSPPPPLAANGWNGWSASDRIPGIGSRPRRWRCSPAASRFSPIRNRLRCPTSPRDGSTSADAAEQRHSWLIILRPFIPDIPTKIQIAFSIVVIFFFSSVIDRQKADKEDKESIYPLRISILVSRSFFLYIQFEWWSTVSYANSIVKNSTLCIRMFSRHIFRRFFVNK